MGKGPSKQLKLIHIQQQQVIGDGKNIDETKQGNISQKIKKRNTYVPYRGQKFLNAPDTHDPARTDDENSRDQKPVQNETEGAERTTPEYANYTAERTTPEYANYTDERTTPEYANYIAGCPNEMKLQDPERQTNKRTAGSPKEVIIQDPKRQTNKRTAGSPNEEISQDPERQTNKRTAGCPNETKHQDPERQTNERTAGSLSEKKLHDPKRQTNKRTAGSTNEKRIPDPQRQTNERTAGSPNELIIQDPERQTNKQTAGSPNEVITQVPKRQTNKRTAGSTNEKRIPDPQRQTNERTAGSPNEIITQVPKRQTNKRTVITQDPKRQTNKRTENDAEFRESTAYANLPFLRQQGHIPNRKKSRHPKCKAELASIRRHYRELKRRVCIQSICDHFIRDGILLEYDLENIMRGSYPRHARVDILLQIMLRKKSQEDFKAFNRALRETGCQDLADKLENTDVEVPDKPYMRQWSSKEVLNAWPIIEEYLMEELQPEYILDFFMQENIFSVDEHEEVFWSLGKRVEMTRTLLEIMKKKLPEALFVLLFALEEVNKDNKNMVEELETLFAEGKDGPEAPENCRTKQANTDDCLVAVHEDSFSVTVPLSLTPVSTVRLTVEKEGIVMENVEIEINNYLNNADGACLLQVFLPPTGCEIIKSERGCVTIYLRPHSKYACDKLSRFCQSGGLKDFVLNLMHETDIFSSLPDGEVCINIQVQYQVGELEAEDAEEINTDLVQSIKDNWSFLCEELDVKALISSSLRKAVLTDDEIGKFKGHTATNRHEDADYFLKCLLKKETAGIQFLMNALEEKQNWKIINRLQKTHPLHGNPKVTKENLIVHFESIVQEIDPSQFMETFVDRKILDKKFFTDLRQKHLRRRCRAALFLKEVLNKGNRAIYALVDVMADMGYDELAAKLVSLEENLLKSNQQKSADDRKEDAVMKVSDVSSRGFTWSCCMKVNVKKKETDETKQQMSGSSSKNEEPIYMNVRRNDVDEGIGGVEADSFLTLRSKEGLSQTNRPVTQPESSLSHYVESDKCMTYPRIRESDEVKKGMRSLIISATQRDRDDSGIDISISK
ncbi:hypothetical protein ACJMK2_040814 [Sinanodonta woodiana]|uniref:CARD domain-containing protein n=1 Tax=Sinanodonta woodiana TaxID=1069815 RepID=A0ABD3W5H3_SINWO